MNNSKLLSQIKKIAPKVAFEEASTFYWSPKNCTIYMNSQKLEDEEGQWALVHEVGHALLGHKSYDTDMGLLRLEVEAWQKAQDVGKKLSLTINGDHIQTCLDTYRDWLYARSTCPTCMLNSLQIDETTYLCMNCTTRWSVSGARFCRPYRRVASREPSVTSQAGKHSAKNALFR